ncbi:MAG: GspH/FimT family protein [Victivallaceae bacterium]|nr:GspH/FimT family protein [Victivallaceae bacterium]
MKFRRHNFSLVELIVVVALMAMLLLLAMPAFRRLMVGDAVTGGARNLFAALTKARTEAIMSGKPVAVLIPWGTLNSTPTEYRQEYWFRAFAVAPVVKNASDWVIDTTRLNLLSFHTLPPGVVLPSITNAEFTSNDGTNKWAYFIPGNSQVEGEKVKIDGNDLRSPLIPWRGAADSTSRDAAAVIFLPSGSATKDCFLAVTQGRITISSGKSSPIEYPENVGAKDTEKCSPLNAMGLLVRRFTGSVEYRNLSKTN